MSALENAPSPEPNGGAPSSFPEPAAGGDQPTSPAPAAIPANESRRETLERNFKNLNSKPRDERGKFAPAATDVPRGTLPAPEVPIVAAPPRPAMPKSYRKELESHWNTLPEEFAASVVQRESDYEKGVAPLKERAKQADELLNEFKPYEQLIQQEGGTPQGAIRDLLRTAAIFRTGTPALKAQTILGLMQQFSVPMEHIQQVLSGSPLPQPQGFDPSQITQLVEQKFSDFQQQQAVQQGDKEVEIFAANPEHKHFDAVQDWMSDILASQKFRAEHQGASAQDKLKAAYTLAIRMDPALSQAVAAEQQAATVAQTQVAQARKAAVLVKGSPPTGAATSIDPKDRRAYIEHQFRVRR